MECCCYANVLVRGVECTEQKDGLQILRSRVIVRYQCLPKRESLAFVWHNPRDYASFVHPQQTVLGTRQHSARAHEYT